MWETVIQMMREVANALAHIHSVGLVHRDVKPGNIVVDALGMSKLGDFGSSVALEEAGSAKCGGTVNYMAPEVIRGQGASPATDVWSLAATAFCLLYGNPPYCNGMRIYTPPAVVRRRVERRPVVRLPTHIPMPLGMQTVLRSALSPVASQRPTARQMADALTALLANKRWMPR